MIREVTTKEELKELYDHSAMTWEGLRKEDYQEALEDCSSDPENDGYYISGATMNTLCKLTERNAYPNDLNIFCIKHFQGLAIWYGARWLDDIIDNNADRQNYHPF